MAKKRGGKQIEKEKGSMMIRPQLLLLEQNFKYKKFKLRTLLQQKRMEKRQGKERVWCLVDMIEV